MSPRPDERTGRRRAVEPGPGGDISPERIAHHVRQARRLRADALARLVRRLGAAFARLARGTARPAPAASGDDALSLIADRLRNPLTSIRSSAEILRDNPDIDPAERRRFVAIVLAEEARLADLVSEMLEASSIERRRRVWRVPLTRLRPDRRTRASCST